MERVYSKPKSLRECASPFCPGCFHGIAQKLLGDTLDKLKLREKTIGVLCVGCTTLSRSYLNFDLCPSSHGRAPATATGVKRCQPDKIVFTYQGDGDLAAIGLAEIMHCANRGENITTIFVNNGTYGMTGGQMAPTTLAGQKATTCPEGRNPDNVGYPLRMAEIIASLEAPAYVARFALNTPANILKAQKGLEKAFKLQMDNKGYSFVELLSNCPTNWKMNPVDTVEWMNNNTLPYFPLGEFKAKE